MPRKYELAGQRFGRLTVLSEAPRTKGSHGESRWNCRCDCGGEKTTGSYSLRTGNTQSCGCLHRERISIPLASLLGQRFGRLTVLSEGPRHDPERRRLLCRCDCGTEKTVGLDEMRHGRIQSCGCLQRERLVAANKTHGHSKIQDGRHSRVYSAWAGMLQRCSNPKTIAYEHYGGRGITVCEKWRSFEAFLADMGEPPDGHSLDRIDNDGNYEPGNCRWATQKTQSNNKRVNRTLTLGTVTDTISGWAERIGLTHQTLQSRLRLGWSVERALTEPLHLEDSRRKR